MKIKLIIGLSLLFNSIILNSCGPEFWRQGVEDDSQPYISRQEVLQGEIDRLKQQRRQLVQNFDNMIRFMVGINDSPQNSLAPEVYFEIWKHVRSLSLQLPPAE